MKPFLGLLFSGILISPCIEAGETVIGVRTLRVPDGFEVELAADPALVGRPISVARDEKGRLYVTDSGGMTERAEQQLAAKPHSIRRLEDVDGDGIYDHSTLFANKLMFPEGCLWHAGSLYVAAPPEIWKFTDADDDGQADKREVWFDGTTLTAKGMSNAISVIAVAPRGAMFDPSAVFYMNKLVVGPEAAGAIDINKSTGENLRAIAAAKKVSVSSLTVVTLDRPRHDQLVAEIREAGARIKFITDGDVAGAVMAARPETGIDVLMGIGGTPEGIIAACAMKCMGGEIQGKLHPRSDQERAAADLAGLDLSRVYTTNDLVSGEDHFFAATGITDGELLKGIRYTNAGMRSQSIVMRSKSRTIRVIDTEHPLERMN